MEIRNGKPWANPEGYEIVRSNYIEDERQEWRCIIDQFSYHASKDITFYIYPAHQEDRQTEIDADISHKMTSLFRVRRKILHGYTVRDCPLPVTLEKRCNDIIISQTRHNYEKHLVNYSYPTTFWVTNAKHYDSHTIALFRVKRKGVNNGR